MEEFIKLNKEMWSSFTCRSGTKKILIEEPHSIITTHILAVYSIMLNQSKGYVPVWRYSTHTKLGLLKSYIDCSEYSTDHKIPWLSIPKILYYAIASFLKICKNKDILAFSYDGVKYGDIVYDSYLQQEQVGTINKIDFKIFIIILKCITRHESTRKILKSDNFDAVLVSHRIGIGPGVMLRTALRYGFHAYSAVGQTRGTLMHSVGLDQAIDYEYEPSLEDIRNIVSLDDEKFNKIYNFVLDEHILGKLSFDSKYAFSNKFYKVKEDFCRDYHIDPNKKNIFVMLHAFTDHPHSHFKWMIFKDYFDWFIETLKFAKNDNTVNWIFKQHPSAKFYPIKNFSLKSLFSNTPDNVIYCDEENSFDTRSLIYVADAVITCLGTAGFELPAMGRVPSITAGDCHYRDLGFAKAPKTREEYFAILSQMSQIEKVNAEQQKLAKAAFIFINYLSKVNMSAVPLLSMSDNYDTNIKIEYLKMISKLYSTKREEILREIKYYIQLIAKLDFKVLRSASEPYERKNVNE